MGQLISLLKSKKAEDVFLDLQKAEPSDKEMKIYQEVQDVLDKGALVLDAMKDYNGANEAVRKTMAPGKTPAEMKQIEEAAFIELSGCVEIVQQSYLFAADLERALPQLLLTLAEPPEEKGQSLEDQQALAKQLAHILDFVLQFDAVRMTKPSVPNDVSFYRRLLPKHSKHPKAIVNEDDTNSIALFTGDVIPMLNACTRAASKSIEQNVHVATALAVMANSCHEMLRSKKFNDDEATELLAVRAMVGSLVLFDHVDPRGAFHSGSPIQTKRCVSLLSTMAETRPELQALKNALKFSTKHYGDSSTPKGVRKLLE